VIWAGLLADVVTPGAAPVDVAATGSGTAEFVVFWIVAPIALGSAISVILLRNAVHAALMLVLNFFAIAVLYAVLEAQFLAVVQVIVYAGAIMVLFLFVLMLLGIDRDLRFTDRIRGQKAGAVLLGVALFVALAVGVARPYLGTESACTGAVVAEASNAIPCSGLAAQNAEETGGNVAGIGRLLFTDYVWPFEVTSVLLVIAALGAMVLGRRAEKPSDLVDVDRTEEDDVVDEQAPLQRRLEGKLAESQEAS
jgi:NADH-quinone oxidoreductase subunit J